MAQRQLMSIRDACAYLGGIHRATLFRWTKAGALPIYKLGARTMYDQADLNRFVNRSKITFARGGQVGPDGAGSESRG